MPTFDFVVEAVREIFLGNWYWLLPLSTFLEGLALVSFAAPGVITVLLGGYYAGIGQLSMYMVFILAITGTILGDIASYAMGKSILGKRFEKWMPQDKKSLILAKIEKRAAWFLLFYHFSGYGRAFVPMIAGAMRMPFKKWLIFSVIGSFSWTSFLVVSGYLSGKYASDLFSQYKLFDWLFLAFFVFWTVSLAVFIWKIKNTKNKLNS